MEGTDDSWKPKSVWERYDTSSKIQHRDHLTDRDLCQTYELEIVQEHNKRRSPLASKREARKLDQLRRDTGQ